MFNERVNTLLINRIKSCNARSRTSYQRYEEPKQSCCFEGK